VYCGFWEERESFGDMLELRDVGLQAPGATEPLGLLHGISAGYARGHFGAIVGPSGCGKSTLLKVIAGLHAPTTGQVFWEGRDLATERDIAPTELGYVPQFNIAYEALTSRESLGYTARLRVAQAGRKRAARIEHVLEQVGLTEFADRPAKLLSGGQKRRLALALEILSHPALLLSDEVTSGLDPKAEDDIVRLLHSFSRQDNRLVLSVTHSLRHLDLYDSVTVLYRGHLAYQGRADLLLHYFRVPTAEDLFPALTLSEPDEAADRWVRHREHYLVPTGVDPKAEEDATTVESTPLADVSSRLPGLYTQVFALSQRRWHLFFREQSQVWLQLSLLIVFPSLVVLFALHGLPQIANLNMGSNVDVVQQLRESVEFVAQSSKVGGLISGLVMFQVVLLTLMGSNNSAREIVGVRPIFEKEKLGGVRPLGVVLSGSLFLLVLVVVQSVWMTVFVKTVCQFPGDLFVQAGLLFLVNAAVTAVCFAVSSWSRTSEQASLISVYLVGFQLPLSGAVLALPDWIGPFARPLIASYWSWSGLIQTMRDTRFYDVVVSITDTPLSSVPLCVWVLVSHMVLGVLAAYLGCSRSQWE
jgi:ABC-type multidrug transport system ATPase subunit